MKKKNSISTSSGNVFADLGFDNPEEMLAKSELARQINNLIKQKDLTQIEAGKLLGIDQPKISLLRKGKLFGFSLERLFKFLNILGQDITIKVTKTKAKRPSHVSVSISKRKKSPFIKRPYDSTTTTAIHARKRSR